MTMKTRWMKGVVVAGAVVVVGLSVLEWSVAQEAATEEAAEAELDLKAELKHLELAKRAAAEAKRASVIAKKIARIHAGPGPDAMSAIRLAADELNQAEEGEAKAEAEAKLRELLSAYFDEDMNRRADELEDIEERLRQLRSQLERRGNHKPDIIDLQVKVLVNEAAGLGFFSDNGPKGFIFTASDDPWTISGPPMGLPVPVAAPAAAPAPPVQPTRAREPDRGRPREPGERPAGYAPQ
jgi:hypothetical protein